MQRKIQRLQRLRDKTAIVGIGATQQGTFPDLDQYFDPFNQWAWTPGAWRILLIRPIQGPKPAAENRSE